MNTKRKRRFKLKITEHKMIPADKELVIRNYKHIDELKSIAKKTKDKSIRDILQKEISDIRQNLLGEYAHKFFRAKVSLGPHEKEEFYPYYPGLDDISYLKNQLVESLSKNRQDRKTLSRVTREFNGMRYEMVGGKRRGDDDGMEQPRRPTGGLAYAIAADFDGRPRRIDVAADEPEVVNKIMAGIKGGGRVFTEPGTIAKMVGSDEYAQRILRAKRPYDKSNYVGVEIELICKMGRDKLNELFIENRLAGMVYVKHDGSIQVENPGEQTHEVTIIGKQQNINDVVARVCKVLNSEAVGSYVNNSCGLHVHLDMRNRDPKVCYMNLFKALPILAGMVPSNRTRDNVYCRLNKTGDFDNLERMDRTTRRRQAINPVAYDEHRTIEVRLHSGSINANKINNWINILTAVVDKKESLGDHAILVAEDMRAAFGIDEKLVEYIKMRTDKFVKQDVSTKADHFDNAI